MSDPRSSGLVMRGARFWIEGEGEDRLVMFQFVHDSRSCTAPRQATREDAERFPGAWSRAGVDPEINPPPIQVVEPEVPPPAPPRPHAEKRARAEG